VSKLLKIFLLLTSSCVFLNADEQALSEVLATQTNDEYQIQKSMEARIRLSYEELPLSDKDTMGIVGIHYDIFPFESLPYLYSGLGMYGAATGKEGGFFALGYTLGAKYPVLESTYLDAGLFIGGGGGSNETFPGPGLMTRAHFGVEQKYKNTAFKLGIARTDFPETLNSQYAEDYHAYVGIAIDNDAWENIASSENLQLAPFDGTYHLLRISPSVMYYKIDDKPTKRADRYSGEELYQADMTLLGIQVERFVDENIFLSFEAYGAGKNAAGYATIHTGAGYVLPITSYLNWENKLLLGLAGDGRIDTGGGLIVQPMTGLSVPLSDSLSLKSMIGRTYAPDGRLSATTVDMALSWQATAPSAKKGMYKFDTKKLSSLSWNMASGVKFYRPDASVKQSNGTAFDETLGLVGFDLGVPLNDYLDAIGNTYWAASGNIGSYAEGMFGLKAHTKPLTRFKISPMISAEGGVAGGGSMEVDGVLCQVTTGVSIPTKLGFDVELNAGRVQTTGDSFMADVYTLKLNWKQISLFRN
jgi:hypothetical protein